MPKKSVYPETQQISVSPFLPLLFKITVCNNNNNLVALVLPPKLPVILTRSDPNTLEMFKFTEFAKGSAINPRTCVKYLQSLKCLSKRLKCQPATFPSILIDLADREERQITWRRENYPNFLPGRDYQRRRKARRGSEGRRGETGERDKSRKTRIEGSREDACRSNG